MYDEIVSANKAYAESFGDRSELPRTPSKHCAILTCMDARIDPLKLAGLVDGEANIIRNAGGRASDDAIRSLIISYKLLGTREFFVIHHTNCGLLGMSNQKMAELLESSLEPAVNTPLGFIDAGEGPGSPEGHYMNFLPIRDQEESIKEDVQRIQNHPLIPKWIQVYGFLYDVFSGSLQRVI